MYRKDRDSRGGGVLLALSNRFRSRQIQSPSHLDYLLIQVSAPKPLFVCLVYIPPCSDLTYYSALFDFISVSTNQSEVVLLGDFNCPDVNWSSLTASEYSSRLLCDFVFDNDLCQLVVLPTHIHGNILDLVLVCSPGLISNLHVLTNQPQFPSSDHYPITFTLHFPILSAIRPSIQFFSTIEVITRVFRTFYSPLISLFSSLQRMLIFFGRV